MKNGYGMYRNLEHYLRNYEKEQAAPPYETVVNLLQAPYADLRNYDEFVEALRGAISEEAAEAWVAYPDFTYKTRPRSVAEAAEKMRPELRARAEELTQELLAVDLLYADENEKGEAAYTRNYLFGIAFDAIYYPGFSPLEEACYHWWFDIVDNGGSAQLRATQPDYRTLAHEGTLSGDAKYGRIPMNLEIPDGRDVLPMDRTEEIIRSRRRIAVYDCICRKAKEQKNIRECDFPMEVCLAFNQAADGMIACGMGREIDAEEALKILRQCRDLGMVQQVTDAKDPLCICNCCSCCCACLVSMKRFEETVAKASRFVADAVHREACIGCGACAKSCPMDAVVFDECGVQVKSQACIGCGICVSRCPKAVLKMSKRPGASAEIERDEVERFYI